MPPFDGLENQAIQHLQRAPWMMLRADDVADGVGGVIDGLEDAQKSTIRLGIARMRTQAFAGDAEGPFRADDNAGEVVAGVVLGRACRFGPFVHRGAPARRRARD